MDGFLSLKETTGIQKKKKKWAIDLGSLNFFKNDFCFRRQYEVRTW